MVIIICGTNLGMKVKILEELDLGFRYEPHVIDLGVSGRVFSG